MTGADFWMWLSKYWVNHSKTDLWKQNWSSVIAACSLAARVAGWAQDPKQRWRSFSKRQLLHWKYFSVPLIGFSELVNHMTIILELKLLPLRDLDYWVREWSQGSGPEGRAFLLGLLWEGLFPCKPSLAFESTLRDLRCWWISSLDITSLSFNKLLFYIWVPFSHFTWID